MKKKEPNAKPTTRLPKATARFTRDHLSEFRTALLARRTKIMGAYQRLEVEGLKTSGQEGSGDLSTVPLHMADVGSDTFERDMALGLMEGERTELREIDAAVKRMKEGSFGFCELCKNPIPLSRLRAIPYTRLCVDCKEKEERVG